MFNYPSIADILLNDDPMFNQSGIDTIRLVAHYKAFQGFIEREGLSVMKNIPSNNATGEAISKVNKAEKPLGFNPVVEVVKIADKGKTVSNFIIIIRHTSKLVDLAKHHKKSKETFCSVIVTGLQQPISKVTRETMQILTKMTKRKTFKRDSIDIAIDHQADTKPINYEGKELFKQALMPLSKHGVIVPPNGATTYYINEPQHPTMSKIAYYDKYQKETKKNSKKVDPSLKNWKRLEVTISFDIKDPNNKGFGQYFNSLNFIDDLYEIDEVTRLAGIGYDQSYLNYQVNSLQDNRTMNNRASKEQFNSSEALTRFKTSDFRPCDIEI